MDSVTTDAGTALHYSPPVAGTALVSRRRYLPFKLGTALSPWVPLLDRIICLYGTREDVL